MNKIIIVSREKEREEIKRIKEGKKRGCNKTARRRRKETLAFWLDSIDISFLEYQTKKNNKTGRGREEGGKRTYKGRRRGW